MFRTTLVILLAAFAAAASSRASGSSSIGPSSVRASSISTSIVPHTTPPGYLPHTTARQTTTLRTTSTFKATTSKTTSTKTTSSKTTSTKTTSTPKTTSKTSPITTSATKISSIQSSASRPASGSSFSTSLHSSTRSSTFSSVASITTGSTAPSCVPTNVPGRSNDVYIATCDYKYSERLVNEVDTNLLNIVTVTTFQACAYACDDYSDNQGQQCQAINFYYAGSMKNTCVLLKAAIDGAASSQGVVAGRRQAVATSTQPASTSTASFPECTALGTSYTAPDGKVFEPIRCGFYRAVPLDSGSSLGYVNGLQTIQECVNYCSTIANCSLAQFGKDDDGTYQCQATGNYPFYTSYAVPNVGQAFWRDAPPYDGPPA